jgi:hypothetical protein
MLLLLHSVGRCGEVAVSVTVVQLVTGIIAGIIAGIMEDDLHASRYRW